MMEPLEIEKLTAERDLYKEFYEMAFDLDYTSDMSDLTKYDGDVAAWADVVDVIDRIKALRGAS